MALVLQHCSSLLLREVASFLLLPSGLLPGEALLREGSWVLQLLVVVSCAQEGARAAGPMDLQRTCHHYEPRKYCVGLCRFLQKARIEQ